MTLRQLFFALCVVCGATSPAYADWKYVAEVDEFDDSKLEYVEVIAGGGRLGVFSDHTGAASFEVPSITWAPGASYICRVDVAPSVDWIVIGENGEQIAKGTVGATVSRSGVNIFLDDHLYLGRPKDVIDAMWGLKAREVRFRFRDSCGEVHVSKFTLAGFREAIWELAKRDP